MQRVRTQETLKAADVGELRREIAVGLKQLDRGETATFTAKDIQKLGRRIRGLRKVSAGKSKRGS